MSDREEGDDLDFGPSLLCNENQTRSLLNETRGMEKDCHQLREDIKKEEEGRGTIQANTVKCENEMNEHLKSAQQDNQTMSTLSTFLDQVLSSMQSSVPFDVLSSCTSSGSTVLMDFSSSEDGSTTGPSVFENPPVHHVKQNFNQRVEKVASLRSALKETEDAIASLTRETDELMSKEKEIAASIVDQDLENKIKTARERNENDVLRLEGSRRQLDEKKQEILEFDEALNKFRAKHTELEKSLETQQKEAQVTEEETKAGNSKLLEEESGLKDSLDELKSKIENVDGQICVLKNKADALAKFVKEKDAESKQVTKHAEDRKEQNGKKEELEGKTEEIHKNIQSLNEKFDSEEKIKTELEQKKQENEEYYAANGLVDKYSDIDNLRKQKKATENLLNSHKSNPPKANQFSAENERIRALKAKLEESRTAYKEKSARLNEINAKAEAIEHDSNGEFEPLKKTLGSMRTKLEEQKRRRAELKSRRDGREALLRKLYVVKLGARKIEEARKLENEITSGCHLK